MPIVTAFDVIAKTLKAASEQTKKVTTTAPTVAPVVRSRETDAAKVAAGKPTVQAPVTSAVSVAAAGVSAGIAAAKKAVEAAPVVKVSEPAPTETRKVISTDIMGNRTFTTYQITSPTGEVKYSVYEGGKPVSGLDNLTSGSGTSTKIGKMVYGSSYVNLSKKL